MIFVFLTAIENKNAVIIVDTADLIYWNPL